MCPFLNNLIIYFLVYGSIANLVCGVVTKSITTINDNEDDPELTPYQLKRLVEENVLRKGDIAKLPCIRRSRKCLVESIKERGWKNEKKLNKILNTILHIHNERKFIDQAVRLMIEDHSELLKGSKNDEEVVAKYNAKHHGKKRSRNTKGEKRSSVPVSFDFLVTDRSLNDFKNINDIDNAHDYNEDEVASMFSEEERHYISNLKTKKSQIANPGYNDAPYGYDGNMYGQQGDEAAMWQQPVNRNNLFSDNEFTRQADTRYFDSNSPMENTVRDSYENTEYSQDGFQRGNILPSLDESSYEKKEDSGDKKDLPYMPYPGASSYPEPYPGSYPSMYSPQSTTRVEALAKLKAAASANMEAMKDVKVKQEKPKPKKLTAHEKAMVAHKLRKEKIKQLYNPKPSDFTSGLNDVKKVEKLPELEESIKKLTPHEKAMLANKLRNEKINQLYNPKPSDFTNGLDEQGKGEDDDLAESIRNLDKGWDLNIEEDASIPSVNHAVQQMKDNNVVKKHSPGKYKPSKKKNSKKKKEKKKNKKKKQVKKSKKKNNGKKTKEFHHTPTPSGASDSQEEGSPTPEMHYKYPISNVANQLNESNTVEGERKTKTNLPRMIGPTIGSFSTQTKPTEIVPDGSVKASRVCKPGVMKPNFEGKPNCLIIGDSIALGYSYSASAALNGSCQVQLAPASKAGAAMDSGYGNQCLDYFLSTISLQPTQYDVILFNFGLHDIDYLDKYPEEFHDINAYVNNLQTIKRRLLDTGATVGFVLSTPVTYNKTKDDLIRKYNHAAKKAMEEGEEKVMTINLHKIVTRECGPAPFENCYMMKKPHDVHYGVTGSIMLGKRVASAISYLLKKRKLQRSWTALTPSSVDLALNKTQCAVPGTACPSSSVCMHNIVSRSGHACCQLQGGQDCGDSWHCCPTGTTCHPQCSDTKCSCITAFDTPQNSSMVTQPTLV